MRNNNFIRKNFLIYICFFSVFPLFSQDEICVPSAIGVPYSSGAPNWWASPAPITLAEGAGLYNRIDDPRWHGAASVTFDNGAIDSYHFRALQRDGHLLLSWMIKKVLYGTGENRLYLALSRGASYSPSGIIIFEILVNNGMGNNAPPSAVITKTVDASACTTGSDLDPAYEADIHAWDGNGSDYWGINIKLPLDTPLIPGEPASIEIPSSGDQIFMFYELLMGVVNNNQIEFSWPRGSQVSSAPGCDLQFPQIADWGALRIGTGATSCSGGITIDRLDIGTNHAAGEGYISRTLANTFYAKPLNNTGSGMDSIDVHARFRIANWGIQPATNTNLSNAWQTIPGLEDVNQLTPGTITTGDKWNIHETLPAGTAFFNDFDDVVQNDHQCILVELFGADLYFERNSVFRNMNFIATSEYEEEAEINVNGLPALPEGNTMRDVYLHVQTKNMPDEVKNGRQKMTFSSQKDLKQKFAALKDKRAKIKNRSKERAIKYKANQAAAAVAVDSLSPYTDEQLVELINSEKSLSEHIAESQPTYIVHGYYDTGRKIIFNETEHGILRPMTSFGYFAMHNGAIEGWEYELSSKYAGFEKIAPDWYKISTDSVVKIDVRIASLEPGIPCWVWLILVIILIIIIIIRFKKK